MRIWLVLVAAVAGSAHAQGERVRIAPLPLKTVTGEQKLDQDLPRKFEMRLLATKQVECPLPDKVTEFLSTRSGLPCEKDAACLKTLAENMSSLYSLAAAVRLNAARTAFEVSATLFRVDGVKKEIAFQTPVNPELALAAGADEALKQLIGRLELEKLERVLPLKGSEPVATHVPAETRPAEAGISTEMPRTRMMGYGAAAMGAVGIATGLILMSVASGTGNSALNPSTKYVLSDRRDEFLQAKGLQTGAVIALVAGGLMGALGVVLISMPQGEVQARVSPVPGGAVVGVGGRLP